MIRTGLKLAKLSGHLLLLKTSLQNPVLLRQVEIVINKQLQYQPTTSSYLGALQGQPINITIQGFGVDRLGLEWNLLVMHKQILVNTGLAPEASAEININLRHLPGYVANKSGSQAISLHGDINTLLQLQGLANTAKFDLYPGLIKIFGAQAAVLLMDIAQNVRQQILQLRHKLATL